MRATVSLAASGLLLCACDKPREPTPSDAPARAPVPAVTAGPAHTAHSAGAEPRDMIWEAPGAWRRVETGNAMRKATYAISRVAGDAEDAEVTVSQAGGSTDANVKRWEGQFEERVGQTERDDRRVGDLRLTVVQIRGKFAGGGMPGAPASAAKPGWAMIAVIVHTQPAHFFKVTGPERTVMGARADIDRMIDTFRPK